MWWSQLVPLFSQSVRLDEAQSLSVATRTIPDIIRFMVTDVHPPLYLILLHAWVQIFGNDIVAARMMSLLFAVLTLPALYKLSYESVEPPMPTKTRKAAARLTVLLFMLSPFVLWFSAETRMYTLFTLVATVSHLYFLRFLRTENKNNLALYGLATIVGLYTHYFYIFVVLSQFVYILIKKKSWKTVIARWFEVMLVAGILFSPWVIYFALKGLGAGSQPYLPKPSVFELFSGVATFLFGFQSPTIEAAIVSMWPLMVLFFLTIFTKPRVVTTPVDYFVLVTTLPVLLVFGVSFIHPIFLIRYLIFVLPTMFFLIAWLVEGTIKRGTRWWAAGLLLAMSGSLVLQDLSSSTPVKEDYQGVATYLQQSATPSDIVALSAPFTIYPMEYVYQGHTRLTTIPEWDRYSVGPIPPFSESVLAQEVSNWKQIYARVFVVLSYDQGYQKSIVNYMDGNLQLLDSKDFPSGINVRVYKLRYDI